MVRNSNDKTQDNRLASFRDWLCANGYPNLCCVQSVKRQEGIWLIGSYIDHLGDTPYNAKGDMRKSATLNHHKNAAASFLSNVLFDPFSIYTIVGGKEVEDRYISSRIETYKKWDTKRAKREPYTIEMFQTFRQQVQDQELQDPRLFLSKLSLIFDTQCLGIFTGSRVSEYAQSQGTRDTVSRVPVRRGTTAAQALPIAFVAGDFEFLSSDGRTVPHEELHRVIPVQLNITFRYDKSGRNFEVRKFGPGAGWLCPIGAACRLICRASMLGIPPTDPLCAFRDKSTTTHLWLRDTHVTQTMRDICVATYPDASHFLRQNIQRFASHSNRVTAAVALSQSNMSFDEIAHRLRWKPESVAFYLRESSRDVGAFTANTIAGAQREFTAHAAVVA